MLRKIFLGGSYKVSFESGSYSCLRRGGAEKRGGSYKWSSAGASTGTGGGSRRPRMITKKEVQYER